jgi:hypothetical protein
MPEEYKAVEIFGRSVGLPERETSNRAYSRFANFIKMAIWDLPSLRVVRLLGSITFDPAIVDRAGGKGSPATVV